MNKKEKLFDNTEKNIDIYLENTIESLVYAMKKKYIKKEEIIIKLFKKKRKIDISGLDFTDYPEINIIDFSGIKGNLDIYQDSHANKGKIIQGDYKNKGKVEER